MEITKAQQIAEQLLAAHGLSSGGWTIDWMYEKRVFGRCCYREKFIQLSVWLVGLNSEEKVTDTILHEIAHALKPGAGHNDEWKRECIRIGANPERCFSLSDTAVPVNYVAVCKCGKEFKRLRRTNRRFMCGICRQVLDFQAV